MHVDASVSAVIMKHEVPTYPYASLRDGVREPFTVCLKPSHGNLAGLTSTFLAFSIWPKGLGFRNTIRFRNQRQVNSK